MKKFILVLVVIVVIAIFGILYFVNSKKNFTTTSFSDDIDVVATMDDKISADTAWCGTFQLVWNDMIDELVKKDVEFENQLEIVDNLNKRDFTVDNISEEYYYKKFGVKSIELKNEIENGIKEKFNETSDVLDSIDWTKVENRYIFYVMLKKDFTYEKEFSDLKNGKFAGKYDNIKYFGIDDDTDDEVREQVDVLYYNSKDDCAVILNTVEGEQVILCKGINGNNFSEIYDNMKSKAESYAGKTRFGNNDYLRVPEIEFNIMKEYSELENKIFYSADNDEMEIMKALQTIKLNMDKKGGSIKSEAVMDLMKMSLVDDEKRNFDFDDEYVMFLQETGREKPYFAMCVNDITKFQ